MTPDLHTPPPGPCFVDLSARAKLRLRGADRLRFLNGQVTNDVRRASATESVYAGVLTAKGKLCADAFICAGPEFLQLDAEPELRETLAARLERYLIADDVGIEDVTETLGLLHLLGGELENVEALPDGAHGVRSQRFGQPGLDLFFDPAALPAFRLEMTAHRGRRELDAEEAERLRILAGVPRWGAELDENTLPPEVGLEARMVDYAKGCYVGQEVISRLKSLGRVNRHLRRLRAAGPTPLLPGQTLLSATDGPEPRKEIGRVTSVAAGPAGGDGFAVALGYVRRGWEAPGTRLLAANPTKPDAASEIEVVGPPFSPA